MPAARLPKSARSIRARARVSACLPAHRRARVLAGPVAGGRRGSWRQALAQFVHRVAQTGLHGFASDTGDLTDGLQA